MCQSQGKAMRAYLQERAVMVWMLVARAGMLERALRGAVRLLRRGRRAFGGGWRGLPAGGAVQRQDAHPRPPALLLVILTMTMMMHVMSPCTRAHKYPHKHKHHAALCAESGEH